MLGPRVGVSGSQPRAPPYGGEVDFWSLGCVAYELLAGHVPFVAATIEELVRAILTSAIEYSGR